MWQGKCSGDNRGIKLDPLYTYIYTYGGASGQAADLMQIRLIQENAEDSVALGVGKELI